MRTSFLWQKPCNSGSDSPHPTPLMKTRMFNTFFTDETSHEVSEDEGFQFDSDRHKFKTMHNNCRHAAVGSCKKLTKLTWHEMLRRFLGQYCPRQKGRMSQPFMYARHRPVKQSQTTTPGTLCPTLFDKCANHLRLKMQKMGPSVIFLIREYLNL